MNLNPLTWLQSLVTAQQVAADEAAVPKKTISLVHVALMAIEAKEGSHPVLLSATKYIDGLVEAQGEELMTSVEHALIDALCIRYPLLAPMLIQAKDQTPVPLQAPVTPPSNV